MGNGLRCKAQYYKTSRGKCRTNHYDLGLGKDSVIKKLKAWTIKEKLDVLDFIEPENFRPLKDTVTRMNY